MTNIWLLLFIVTMFLWLLQILGGTRFNTPAYVGGLLPWFAVLFCYLAVAGVHAPA